MAARLNKLDTSRVLERIKLSQLINRLQDNALGKLKITNGENKGKATFMTESQVSAAKFLIERRVARAEAPKDLNLTFAGRIEVEFVRGS